MNDMFRQTVFDILSNRFGRESVLLEYPFEKSVDGFVLSKDFIGKGIEENCKEISICLNNIEEKLKKYIGLILPVTFEEIEEQVDDTRDAILSIAIEMINTVSEEINIRCIKFLSDKKDEKLVELVYEDVIDRLKKCTKSRKQIGTYAKSVEALILYGYNFYDKGGVSE